MHVIIDTRSMVPIYEQIVESIRKKIVKSELSAGDPLPSVRALSSELKISALTVKKAYDRLEEEGYTTTVHGKGTYVTGISREVIAEQQKREVENDFAAAVEKARRYGLTDEEIREILGLILED
jgi:GntR family transcriptional regulator